jgi:hypothetical protein
MAAVPRFTDPSAAPWPVSPGPSRPAATILRFPRPTARVRSLTPVACDPSEGSFVPATIPLREFAAGWVVVLGLALLSFVIL